MAKKKKSARSETPEKNLAAVWLGRLGGKKTAERGPDYYRNLQAKRKKRAGGRPRKLQSLGN
jgi:hypothetical protein